MIGEDCVAFTDPCVSFFVHRCERDTLRLVLSLSVVEGNGNTRHLQKPGNHACFFCSVNALYPLKHFEKYFRSKVFSSETVGHTGCNITEHTGKGVTIKCCNCRCITLLCIHQHLFKYWQRFFLIRECTSHGPPRKHEYYYSHWVFYHKMARPP